MFYPLYCVYIYCTLLQTIFPSDFIRQLFILLSDITNKYTNVSFIVYLATNFMTIKQPALLCKANIQ